MRDTTLLRLIAERLDPEEIVDILGLSSQEVALYFMDEIMRNKDKFLEFLDFEEFEYE